jgi:peptide deformylase
MFPDPRLRQPAAPIERFDAALAALAADLTDTLRAAPGIGITGPHIGQLQRIVVIELPPAGPVRVLVNPEVTATAGPLVRHTEGSVSMPGVDDEVERPASVTFRFQDLSGAVHEETASGLMAVVVQHEVDQLDGIFWIQRLSRLKRERLVKRYDKLRRG